MAFPVYSAVLFREAGLVGSRTVPVAAGEVWVVRDLDAYADVSGVGRVDLFLMEAATNAAFAWFNWSSGEQNLKQWRGRQVLTYLDGLGGLIVKNDGGDPVDVSVSGYRLTSS